MNPPGTVNIQARVLIDVDARTAGDAVFDSMSAQPATLKKLVLLTSADDLDEMPASVAGCAHLQKPFDTKQLLASVPR